MKKSNLILLLFIFCAITAFSQNPKVVNGVATYTASKNIGRKFSVPNEWTKIIIKGTNIKSLMNNTLKILDTIKNIVTT